MAELVYNEKELIEQFLGMKTGYVLDFSDRTFQRFIYDSVKKDIDTEDYKYSSNSKANRLRKFIQIESNSIVGKLLEDFYNYWLSKGGGAHINNHQEECLKKIISKLKSDKIVEDIDAISSNNQEDIDFDRLAKNIRECIDNGNPELALDRLHTFIVKYISNLCEKHSIGFQKENSLNSIFGKYVKYLCEGNYLESKMSENILKYSINIIEAFNGVRNNSSLAHNNPILNYDESILIFQNISTMISFIDKIEKKIQKQNKEENIWKT